MPVAALVSFRLGGTDGVSIEAAKWGRALERLGFSISTVAGSGPVEHLVPGLAIGDTEPPDPRQLAAALSGADLVVVENLLSLPLNPAAAEALATQLVGRPALLHHHDLPWQRPQFADRPPPPDNRRWRHVTVNHLSRRQLARRGIEAVTIHNTFDTDAPAGRRHALRRVLGLDDDRPVVLQPTRALARKGVGAGIALAEQLGAIYWLLGPAEDGYGPALDRLLAAARCPVRHGWPQELVGAGRWQMADAYAAAELVTMPSIWEGFGNPTVESALHRRPLAVAPYPVARELAAFGFRWFWLGVAGAGTASRLAGWLAERDTGLLEHNARVAADHFSSVDLPGRLAPVLATLGFGAADSLPAR